MGARRDKRVREDVLFEGSSRIFQVGSLHNKHGYQSIHILGVGKYFNYKSLHDNIIAKVCACVFVHVLVQGSILGMPLPLPTAGRKAVIELL